MKMSEYVKDLLELMPALMTRNVRLVRSIDGYSPIASLEMSAELIAIHNSVFTERA